MILRDQWAWRLGAPSACGWVTLINGWGGLVATIGAALLTWRAT